MERTIASLNQYCVSVQAVIIPLTFTYGGFVRMFTTKQVTALLLALGLSSVSFALPQQDQSAKQDMKDAGQATKQAAKDTGRATKKAAKTTGHEVKKTTKKATHKTAEKTKEGAQKVEDKTKPN